MPEAKPALPLSQPSLSDDHAALCAAVREAGYAALERYNSSTVKSWDKADNSPVCDADMEANEILRTHLMTKDRAHYGWLSEENTDDLSRLEAPRTWIVDPVDGTRAFLRRDPEWTVCAVLLEGCTPVSSAIFNPVTDEFFEAELGKGTRLNAETITASKQASLSACSILGWQRMSVQTNWPAPWPPMSVSYRCSTSYRMALVAKGEFDAALALVPKPDWDVAMGSLIANEAGAIVSDHLGQPFCFNQRNPVQRGLVCSAPELYPAVIERLDHLPDDLRGHKS